MPRIAWRAFIAAVVLVACVFVPGCSGSNAPAFDSPGADTGSGISSIAFQDTTIPDGGEGQLYNVILGFIIQGNAELPDRFEVGTGVLPDGVQLLPEVDATGAPTGSAQLVGFPRERGDYAFSVRAISTATDPALAAEQPFAVNIDSGQIAILTPTAAEGTTDV